MSSYYANFFSLLMGVARKSNLTNRDDIGVIHNVRLSRY